MIDYEKILELGKAARPRPYVLDKDYRLKSGLKTVADLRYADGFKTAPYIAIAANSADLMAQQLLAIRKLCDGNGSVRKEDVCALLENQQ